MEYTREEAMAAGKKAVAAGDIQAANEIAAMIDAMPVPQAPPVAPVADTPLTDKLLGAYDKTVGSVADTMSSYSGLTVDEEETLGSDVEGYGSARQIEGPEALLQGAGAVVGGASSAVMDTALEAVPDVVKDKAGDLAGAAFEKVADTDLGKRGIELAKKGGKAWEGFKKAHPETAKTIGAALEVGLILAPAGKVGSKMVQKGKDQVTNTFAKKIAPVDQIAAGTGRAGKTVEEGLTRARTYKSSADDLDLAQRISEVPGTKANRTATPTWALRRDSLIQISRKQATRKSTRSLSWMTSVRQ